MNNNNKFSRWLLTHGLILLIALPIQAENPFGGAENEPPPPPPPAGDEDILGGETFGFTPPSSAQVPPQVPMNPQNPSQSPSQQGGAPSSPAARNQPGQGKPGAKAAPALADYLQLESSIKELQVKNFDLPDKDIKDVVTLISKWTGKNFILDSKVRGKITIIGPSQVTLQEAYQAFLSALDSNGLTTVQSGKFIRIIESAEARRSPVQTFSGDYAPSDDQFITRIIQLKYINADEVQREFRDLTTRQGKLFAYEPTNSLIITDTGSNIQRLTEILDSLDVKNFETSLHILRVKNNSAKTIAEMLSEIYGDDKKGAAGGANRSFRRSALERTRGGGVISKIIPDEATNSLIVLANKSGFTTLLDLVAKLDVKVADTGRVHVYYCEHAKAEDLAATLASLSGSGGGGSKSRRPSAGGAPGGAPGAAPAAASGPITAELDGGVKITSDSATNALVITANSSDYKTLRRVIRKLDIPRLQVFIETAIMEVALDDNDKWGINYLFGQPGNILGPAFITDADSIASRLIGGPPGEGISLPIAKEPFYPTDLTVSGTKITVPIPNFAALISILAKTTDTSILSTPQIIALDNEKAVFKVQDDVPVIASTSSATSTSPSTQNTERLKTGIDMTLTPHINAASRMIRLEIEQTVESSKGSSGVPENLKNSNVAKTTRITNTQVVVKDNDYIMLGGLISDKIDDSIVKVPLLGDIPILGWLFKARNFKAIKTNLIILLHPRIIGSSLTSANLIKDQMRKRDSFIDKYVSGDDNHKDDIDEIKRSLNQQVERGKLDLDYDYRNNNEDEEDVLPSSPDDNAASKILTTPPQRTAIERPKPIQPPVPPPIPQQEPLKPAETTSDGTAKPEDTPPELVGNEEKKGG